ncbi:MAG: cupin domain-containing protein [Catenulispora sp.]|nr:cupin domain-containing protein [Catenulispora sp.]
MSYPDPRYFADTGEVSATFRPADAPPEITFSSGGTCSLLSTDKDSDGLYGLYRWDFAAAPSGPGTHFHKTMSEAFFILKGAVRLFNGEKWVEATPGDYLFVPPGGLHAFRNESGEEASMLLMFAPGAPRENYFRGLVEGLPAKLGEKFFLEHDQYNVEG